MKDTKTLIAELVNDKKAQKRDFSVLTKSFTSFLFVLLAFYLVSALYNPMAFSLSNRIENVETLCLGFIILSLLSLGFRSLIPGMRLRKNLIATSLLIIFFIAIHSYRTSLSPVYSQIRAFCEVEAICASLITSILAHFYLKRFPLSKYQPFSLAIVWGLSLSASFMLHSTCSNETVHMLLCHLLPASIIPTWISLRK
nr:hypothetical protein BHI3_09060 [Bacteriovorax sp. HI3]